MTETGTSDRSISSSQHQPAEQPLPSMPIAPVGRLVQRLTVAPGVINTSNVHRHQAATATMTDRLLQRLSLPERMSSYSAGVLQPSAAQSFQRLQRKEVMPAMAESMEVPQASFPGSPSSFGDSTLPSASAFREIAPAPAQIARSVEPVLHRQPEITPPTSSDAAATYRIRRRGFPVQDNGAIAPSLGNSSGETSAIDQSSSTSPDELTLHSDSIHSDSIHSNSIHSNSIHSDGSLLPSTAANSSHSPMNSPAAIPTASPPAIIIHRHREPGEPSEPSIDRSPLPANPVALAMGIQRSAILSPSEPSAPPVVPPVLARSQTIPLAQRQVESSPQIASFPVVNPSAPIVQRSPQSPTPQATLPHLRVTAVPAPLQSQSERTVEALQLRYPLASVLQRSPESSPVESAPPALPLAIASTVSGETVNRQPLESSPSSATQSPGASPSIEPAATSALNATDMAEQVSRVLARQLAVERERRGLGL